MDYARKDAVIVETTELTSEQNRLTPLSELQLALVGGGSGEVIFPN